ncbi:MAG TPA: glycerophosphodiester phosphodiesterase family protein, partial [Bacilli bacterium]|nr:glycerophosphodiester phosphodiesterase family protein [Bacilli bacterium]
FPGFRLRRCRADYVSPHYRLLRFGFIKRMKWLKKAVSVWTLNDENLIRKYLKMGVDSLVTDYPNLGLKLRDELSKKG